MCTNPSATKTYTIAGAVYFLHGQIYIMVPSDEQEKPCQEHMPRAHHIKLTDVPTFLGR